MNKLMVTRFNNNTWIENELWRERNEFDGCIYNCPIHIKENVPLMIKIYVIEMNNDTNKVQGIGRIVNKLHSDKNYSMYFDKNYNRFTYKGKKRIDKQDIDPIELEKLETRLFTTKSHLKRGQGITQVPDDVSKKFLKIIDNIFISNF